MHLVLFVVVVATVFTMLAHPVFVHFDRRLARRRLSFASPATHDAPVAHAERQHVGVVPTGRVSLHRTRVLAAPTFHDSSSCLDDMARRLRLGESTIDAFAEATSASNSMRHKCADVAMEASRTGDLRNAISSLAHTSTGVMREFAQAVRIAHVGRSLSVAGLERAAVAHRDRWLVQEEKKSATAASRYSIRTLSLLPLASVVLSPLWGGSTIAAIGQSSAVAFSVSIGVALNLAGIAWCRRVSGSIT